MVRADEPRDLGTDVLEVAGLAPALRGERVAVHGITRPHDGVAGILGCTQQRSQRVLHLVRTHTGDEGEATRDAVGVECLADLEHELRSCLGANLAADRVTDTTEELDVGAVELSGALADPQHVRRAVVPTAREGVLTGKGLFVAEQQCLVAREHVDLVQGGGGLGVHAAGAHEAQRTVDLLGELFVALALGARRDELLGPLVHAVQVGEAALGERAKQVERGRRLVVRLYETLRVGHACGLSSRRVVHDVPAERGKREVADLLERGRSWLRELAGDAPNLHHRHAE